MAAMMWTVNPLISKDEFESCFAIPHKYGDFNAKWPHNTILLYGLSVNNSRICPWQKIENIKNSQHAELVMLEDIKRQITFDGTGEPMTLNIEVFSSYSPCHSCADELIKFRSKLTDPLVNVCIAIQFANFYNDYPGCPDRVINIKGFTDMINNDIVLNTFEGVCDWNRFLVAAGVYYESTSEGIKIATTKERRDRETKDAEKIEQYKADAKEIKNMNAVADQFENFTF